MHEVCRADLGGADRVGLGTVGAAERLLDVHCEDGRARRLRGDRVDRADGAGAHRLPHPHRRSRLRIGHQGSEIAGEQAGCLCSQPRERHVRRQRDVRRERGEDGKPSPDLGSLDPSSHSPT